MAPSVLTFALYALLASRGVLAQDFSDVNSLARQGPQGDGDELQKGTQGPGATGGQFRGNQGGKHRRHGPNGNRPSAEGFPGAGGSKGHGGKGRKEGKGHGGEGENGKFSPRILSCPPQ